MSLTLANLPCQRIFVDPGTAQLSYDSNQDLISPWRSLYISTFMLNASRVEHCSKGKTKFNSDTYSKLLVYRTRAMANCGYNSFFPLFVMKL